METVRSFLKKLKVGQPYDPLLGTYPDKTIIQKDTCTPMFTHCRTIYNSQDMASRLYIVPCLFNLYAEYII